MGSHFRPQTCRQKFDGHEDFSDVRDRSGVSVSRVRRIALRFFLGSEQCYSESTLSAPSSMSAFPGKGEARIALSTKSTWMISTSSTKPSRKQCASGLQYQGQGLYREEKFAHQYQVPPNIGRPWKPFLGILESHLVAISAY